MKTMIRSLTPLFALALIGAVTACGGDDSTTGTPTGTAGSGGGGGSGGNGGSAGSPDSGATRITGSTGDWVVYADALGDAGANPLTGMTGSVDVFSVAGGKMRVKLSVKGLPASKSYGSHIHKLACDDTKAGGHYQDKPFPADSSATDPAYANDMNEAWLDFTTDASGNGSVEKEIAWVPRAGEAKAVMIHAMATATGGVAGAKLACVSVPF